MPKGRQKPTALVLRDIRVRGVRTLLDVVASDLKALNHHPKAVDAALKSAYRIVTNMEKDLEREKKKQAK